MTSQSKSYRAYVFSIIDGTSLAFKIMGYLFWISACCAVIGIICMFGLSGKTFHYLGAMLLLGFLIGNLLALLGRMQFEKFNILGKLIMDSQSISITDRSDAVTTKYNIKDISNIHITFFESQRDVRNGFYGVYGGDGVGNFIEFIDGNRNKNRYEIMVDDDRKLKQLLTSWEESGTKFDLTYTKPVKKTWWR